MPCTAPQATAVLSTLSPRVGSRTGDGKEGRAIKRIKEGGPAAQSKRLAVGDRVLCVDEVRRRLGGGGYPRSTSCCSEDVIT